MVKFDGVGNVGRVYESHRDQVERRVAARTSRRRITQETSWLLVLGRVDLADIPISWSNKYSLEEHSNCVEK